MKEKSGGRRAGSGVRKEVQTDAHAPRTPFGDGEKERVEREGSENQHRKKMTEVLKEGGIQTVAGRPNPGGKKRIQLGRGKVPFQKEIRSDL